MKDYHTLKCYNICCDYDLHTLSYVRVVQLFQSSPNWQITWTNGSNVFCHTTSSTDTCRSVHAVLAGNLQFINQIKSNQHFDSGTT